MCFINGNLVNGADCLKIGYGTIDYRITKGTHLWNDDGFQKALKPIRLSTTIKPTTTTNVFDILVDVAGGELQETGIGENM